MKYIRYTSRSTRSRGKVRKAGAARKKASSPRCKLAQCRIGIKFLKFPSYMPKSRIPRECPQPPAAARLSRGGSDINSHKFPFKHATMDLSPLLGLPYIYTCIYLILAQRLRRRGSPVWLLIRVCKERHSSGAVHIYRAWITSIERSRLRNI